MHATGQNVEVSLGKLVIRVSYQDFILIHGTLQELQADTEKLKQDMTLAFRVRSETIVPTRKRTTTAYKLQTPLASIAPLTSAVASPRRAFPSDGAAQALELQREQKEALPQTASIRLEGLHAVLINDCHGANSPFVAAELGAVTGVIQGFTENMKMKATLQLSASFFNPLRVAWEPLVEPWDCCVFVQRQPAPGPAIKVDILSDSVLNVNAVEAFLSSLSTTLISWRGDGKGNGADDYSPYWLSNETGSPLDMVLAGVTWTVRSGERIAFTPPAPTDNRNTALAPTACIADLILTDDASTARGVQLDRVGKRVWSAAGKWIITDVIHSKGSRRIRVMSPICISNLCATPIDMEIIGLQTVTIVPDASTGIPLGYVGDQVQVRFKPFETDDTCYCKALTPMKAGVGRYKVQCGPKAYYVLTVNEMPHTNRPTIRASVTIALHPPWIVENLTLGSIEVDIRIRDGGVIASCSIARYWCFEIVSKM